MEILKILDENGQETGELKPKKEVHRNRHYHGVCSLWLLNNKNKLLLQIRSDEVRKYPGKLHFTVAGHIIGNESFEDTIIREAFEELRLDVSDDDLINLGYRYAPILDENGEEIDKHWSHDFMIRKEVDIDNLVLQKEEVGSVIYKSLEKVENEINGDAFGKYVSHYKDYYLSVIDKLNELSNLPMK